MADIRRPAGTWFPGSGDRKIALGIEWERVNSNRGMGNYHTAHTCKLDTVDGKVNWSPEGDSIAAGGPKTNPRGLREGNRL